MVWQQDGHLGVKSACCGRDIDWRSGPHGSKDLREQAICSDCKTVIIEEHMRIVESLKIENVPAWTISLWVSLWEGVDQEDVKVAITPH
jgi:hypothetical protein